jgi:glyoxylase-like metal-dependent hydrolase (beta-lactamase superfamily II)
MESPLSAESISPAPIVDISALRSVAEGVFVICDRRVPLVPNVGVVLGEHSALVIDTGMGAANGQAVLDLARSLAGGRKLYLTITHFHPEHGYGAHVFKGQAQILYNRAQGEDLADKGEAYLGMFRGMGPSIAAALEGVTLVAADELYDGPERELDLGGRIAVLKTWGRAHTNGDQIVFLPREGVLFSGDLAEEKTFPIFPWFPPHDMDIDGDRWAQVLGECLSLNPRVVVPGHGEIGGPEILSDVRDYILAVRAEVASALADGKSRDAIVADVRAQMLAAHPDWHFPEWIDFAVRYFIAVKDGDRP